MAVPHIFFRTINALGYYWPRERTSMFNRPKHAPKHHPQFKMPEKTPGEVWHEKAMHEGFVAPLLTFALCMALILACVVVIGGTQAYAKTPKEDLYTVTPQDKTNWAALERIKHEKSKETWANIKAQKDLIDAERARIEEEERARAEAEAAVYYESYKPYDGGSAASGNLRYNGVESDGSYKYTWYSQNVLPGSGLDIPGRHVGDGGYVQDGDGNIVVASSDLAKGTVVETPYGTAKVYDSGCASGVLDVYTNW